MATLPSTEPELAPATDRPIPAASAAVCLPSMPGDTLKETLYRLQQAFPDGSVLIATPDQVEEESIHNVALRVVPYPVQRNGGDWVLNATDYLAASRLAQQYDLRQVVLLGPDAASLNSAAIVALRDAAHDADLAVPSYHTGPHQGLVNSALLYPISRALFGVDIRFPLPLDMALSGRMLARLNTLATRAANDGGLVWPVAEAALSGFTIRQVDEVHRALPQPQEADLNVLLPAVTSSLFADIEAKAAYWQRARPLVAPRLPPGTGDQGDAPEEEEIRALVDNFRSAFSNLREIWSLVLPPQSLLALKRLSLTPAESFAFPQSLWARVVYDFALSFHMRTLNRGHLLGAMTPLYLAWVAGLLREAGGAGGGSALLESTARAFEQEKPYFVSRWRWPDRFNP